MIPYKEIQARREGQKKWWMYKNLINEIKVDFSHFYGIL